MRYRTFEAILERETDKHVVVGILIDKDPSSGGREITLDFVEDFSGAPVETTEEENAYLRELAAKQLN